MSAPVGVRRAARRAVDSALGSWLGSIRGVETDRPLLALTFDDGPDLDWTPQLLEILDSRQQHGTFFMLVERARRCPALLRRIVADGHEIGLHGIDHSALAGWSRKTTASRLEAAADELATISGKPVAFYRPPFGFQSVATFLGARDARLTPVFWDLDSQDWCGGDESGVAANVVDRADAGNIILLHDGLAGEARPGFDRAKHLELVVDGLRRRALRSTTLSSLLASGRARRTVWFCLLLFSMTPHGNMRWTR